MTDDLFSQDQNNTPEIDPNKNYLEELVGDGKKFKSPEDLARGKYEADNYIQILQRRFDELREDNERIRGESAAKARLEEILDKLDSQFHKTDDRDITDNANNEVKPFDPKEIESLFEKKITERETQLKQQNNFNQVRDRLKEHYGENYTAVLEDQIQSLGLTKEFFNDLAKNHPTVLFKTLGLDQKPNQQFVSAPRGSVNFKPTAPKKRTYSYYQNMRKENPTLYFDRKTTIQMHEDAQEQGQAFFDTE